MTKSSPAGRTANTCINHEIEIEFSPNKRGRNPAEEMETARLRLGGGPEREEAEAESRAIDQAEAGIPGERMGAMCLGDRVLFAMVLALALLFAYLSALVGSSDLLGCFFGGLAFSSVPGVRSVWERQVRFEVSRPCGGMNLISPRTLVFEHGAPYVVVSAGQLLRRTCQWRCVYILKSFVYRGRRL